MKVGIPLIAAVAAVVVACGGQPAPVAPASPVAGTNADVTSASPDRSPPDSSPPDSSPPAQLGPDEWAAIPLPPDPTFVAAARGTCLREMDADPSMPLLVEDQRRPDLAALYFEDSTDYDLELIRRARDGTFVCEGGGGGSLPFIRGVALTISDWTKVGDDKAEAWLVAGYVDKRAAIVGIRQLDGREMRASIGRGRFVAFWRGPQQIALLVAFDATGREIARVDDALELGGGPPP